MIDARAGGAIAFVLVACGLVGCGASGGPAGAGVDDAGVPAVDCVSAACGRFSQCLEENGSARCVCQNGYQGARCTDCAPGLQDRDGDGVCDTACAAGACPSRANCDDSTGAIVCNCEPGYVLSGSQCVPDGTVPPPKPAATESSPP